jgi:ADP-ribose pyrophosphatase
MAVDESASEGSAGVAREDFIPAVVDSRLIHEGKVISVRVDNITTASGTTATREVVEHPGAVVIVALDETEHVFLVRQYRHAVGRYLVELPAGGLERGEEPLAAAQRELREEVGLEAGWWSKLGAFFSSPGFANEELHAFLAQGLVGVPAQPDEDEDIEVLRYPLVGIVDSIGKEADAKTLAALYLLATRTGGDRGAEA